METRLACHWTVTGGGGQTRILCTMPTIPERNATPKLNARMFSACGTSTTFGLIVRPSYTLRGGRLAKARRPHRPMTGTAMADGLSTLLVLRRMHGRCSINPGPAWHERPMMVIDPAMDGPMAFRTAFADPAAPSAVHTWTSVRSEPDAVDHAGDNEKTWVTARLSPPERLHRLPPAMVVSRGVQPALARTSPKGSRKER